MEKAYSVDYWCGSRSDGDPDLTDYSNDHVALEAAIPNRISFDGRPFNDYLVYKRTGPGPDEMPMWQPISN